MIKHTRRFASINGAIDPIPFASSKGVPQGDPLSMLAAAALLGSWTLEIPQDHRLLSRVFVDDRLLLSSHHEVLPMLLSFGIFLTSFQPDPKQLLLGITLKMKTYGGLMGLRSLENSKFLI